MTVTGFNTVGTDIDIQSFFFFFFLDLLPVVSLDYLTWKTVHRYPQVEAISVFATLLKLLSNPLRYIILVFKHPALFQWDCG